VVLEPVLVVEVISPSTEREDRGRKKFDYFATPSIQQYAIIEQDERRIDLYTRAGDRWANEVVTGDATLNSPASVSRSASIRSTRTPISMLLGRERTGGKLRPCKRPIVP
jgi:Uma2 family endonuclease